MQAGRNRTGQLGLDPTHFQVKLRFFDFLVTAIQVSNPGPVQFKTVASLIRLQKISQRKDTEEKGGYKYGINKERGS